MLISYVISVFVVVGVTLTIRTLRNDYPIIDVKLAPIPFVGKALSCSFCLPMWASLISVLFLNPIAPWFGEVHSVEQMLRGIFVGWFTLGTGVLIVRYPLIVFMELAALLKHEHTRRHNA